MLWVLFCIGLIGCAEAKTAKYISAYNEAVNNGQSVVIIKEGDFTTTQEGVEQQLKSVGYNKVLYSSPAEACLVLVKDADYGNPLLNGDAKSYQIILKYTKLDAGKTRIDLVNAGTKISVKDGIDKDIQRLAQLIRNS
jgi:hypothetical protein